MYKPGVKLRSTFLLTPTTTRVEPQTALPQTRVGGWEQPGGRMRGEYVSRSGPPFPPYVTITNRLPALHPTSVHLPAPPGHLLMGLQVCSDFLLNRG